jgi:hypothetical protein
MCILSASTSLSGSVSVLEEEINQMTYQVAAFGIDGLILGSDRKAFVRPPNQYDRDNAVWSTQYRQYDSQFKFLRSKDDSIICACSGTQRSRIVADEIIQEANAGLPNLEWERYLRSKCCVTLDAYEEIVVVRHQFLDAFRMVIGTNGDVSPITDKLCTGVTSSACFLATHFYRRKSVDDLKKFVLLVLDCAAREFPQWVGNGYDLVTLREGYKPHWERFGPDDNHLVSLRDDFNKAVNQLLFHPE